MSNPSGRISVGDRVTIYARGKRSIYTAEFWFDGQHRRVSLRTSNKKAAIQRALQLEAELGNGTYGQTQIKKTTIDQAVNDYLDYLRSENRRSKTLVKYRGVLRGFAAFAGQARVQFLHQITPTLFDKFRAARREDHSPKSLYCEGVIVKQLCKWCRSRRLLSENPLTDIKTRKPVPVPKERPSLDQVNAILGTFGEPLHTQLAVLAFTGMRVGQLQRLRPQDLDLAGNWILIQPIDGAKTEHLVKVPIHPRLKLLLEQLPRKERPWLFTSTPSRNYPKGDHWVSAKRLNEAFERVVAKLGMPVGRKRKGFTLHSLRGFFETFCVNANIPQRAIDTWLGHHSDKSMASIYYRLSERDSQKFMEVIPFGTSRPMADTSKKNVHKHTKGVES